MGVAEDFRAFRNNYLIPLDTVGSISYRYKRITRQLNRDFWSTESETAHSLYVGSYGRDTAAKGVSDLDVSFTLPNGLYATYNSYAGNGQSALLQAVRQSIMRTYPTTSVGGDGQVCVIRFDDGITFEVLPVFVNTADTFTFADSNNGGSWRACDPRSEMRVFLARNKETNGNLKAIGRMMRIWKRHNSVPIRGMLIDTHAYNFIQNWPHKDKSYLYHDFLVRDFLKYLSERDRQQAFWAAPGSGSRVYRTGNFERLAAVAYQSAVKAIENESNNQYWARTQAWRAIFGNLYPG
ncbi:nucleotidyltransferase [Rhizobium leguminosarum]|uniref:SMODS domain-containing nucleotidyltransferase n=2 Tax=Rhizobium/Agrobacterium group TaxID=227290 RepID=UPI00103223C4|nr:nucleotidyltransferase [Rhizobium leguminosarum]NKK10919.1 nucleotidyltransferase [Rhizobium leguminosarum bv. viciae]TBF54850.1 nucleotidyltransferase [Rhizobium leguminosarum]TBF75944.1 nucleotidyltransferase [Rhizobium leguminosarum]TBG06829.1 nucleotidyltransferase [Rhizobium leguminosarum]TBG18966.1 nucleotidyltransferase [Rhizobium leguminosarum]